MPTQQPGRFLRNARTRVRACAPGAAALLCAWSAACTPAIDASCDTSAQCKSDEACADGLCIKLSVLYPDAGADAGQADGGDAGSGAGADGGLYDGGSDAGAPDAGPGDGGGTPDDAGTPDAGPPDAGSDGGVLAQSHRLEGGAFGIAATMKSPTHRLNGSVGPLEGTAGSSHFHLNAVRPARAGETR